MRTVEPPVRHTTPANHMRKNEIFMRGTYRERWSSSYESPRLFMASKARTRTLSLIWQRTELDLAKNSAAASVQVEHGMAMTADNLATTLCIN